MCVCGGGGWKRGGEWWGVGGPGCSVCMFVCMRACVCVCVWMDEGGGFLGVPCVCVRECVYV